jgi:hypothetical protein
VALGADGGLSFGILAGGQGKIDKGAEETGASCQRRGKKSTTPDITSREAKQTPRTAAPGEDRQGGEGREELQKVWVVDRIGRALSLIRQSVWQQSSEIWCVLLAVASGSDTDIGAWGAADLNCFLGKQSAGIQSSGLWTSCKLYPISKIRRNLL